MLKKMLAMFLGILLLFSFVLAEDGAATPAEAENYMIPRQFMSMFDASFGFSADLIRDKIGDGEADRLIEEYSLTEYDFIDNCMYYGSKDWLIETTFVFNTEEDVSPDAPCVFWYLILSDEADENAWYLTMYTLNLMIGYTYKDSLSEDVVLHYFQTVNLGDELSLPDGYTFVTFRPDGADYVVFSMEPDNLAEILPDEEPDDEIPAGAD